MIGESEVIRGGRLEGFLCGEVESCGGVSGNFLLVDAIAGNETLIWLQGKRRA